MKLPFRFFLFRVQLPRTDGLTCLPNYTSAAAVIHLSSNYNDLALAKQRNDQQ